MNKLKILSIAICCLVSALWSEAQCMDAIMEQGRNAAYALFPHILPEVAERLENAELQVAESASSQNENIENINSLTQALQEKDREINDLKKKMDRLEVLLEKPNLRHEINDLTKLDLMNQDEYIKQIAIEQALECCLKYMISLPQFGGKFFGLDTKYLENIMGLLTPKPRNFRNSIK